MTNKAKKQLALALYLSDTLYKKDIAKQVGIAPNTLTKWIRDGKWEDIKAIKSGGKEALLEDAISQLKKINEEINLKHEGVPTSSLTDRKSKILKEIKTLSVISMTEVFNVSGALTVWIQQNKPQHLTLFSELFNDFIEELAIEQKLV